MLHSLYNPFFGEWTANYESIYQANLPDIVKLGTNDLKLVGDPLAQRSRLLYLDNLRFARLCAYLRHRNPDDKIAFTNYVFNLSNDELNIALQGTPTELRNDYN